MESVSDRRIDKIVPLVSPALLKHELPLGDAQAHTVVAARAAIAEVLDGADDRLLVVVGPCSVHDPVAALEYAYLLAGAVERLRDDVLIVMRVYFEKPLSTPVGMKNRPDGSIATAVDAIRAAAVPHVFTGIAESGTPAILHTHGNADCHLILRGGAGGPNYRAAAVAEALGLLRAAGLPERLIIDASHGNSGKDHERQPLVVEDIANQVAAGQRGIVGVMLESFLVPGRQDLDPGRPLVHGQSVTDACMGWETTERVLRRLAAGVRQRRV